MKGFSGESLARKKQLADCIGGIVASNGWTQRQAAKQLGISQAKLCNLLNGKFEGVSELKLLNCITLLGKDVRITISRTSHGSQGELKVEFLR